MTLPGTVVRARVPAELIAVGDETLVVLEVFFDVEDPFAVRLRLHSAGSVAQWVVDRGCLIDGLTSQGGEGAVQVCSVADSDRPGILLRLEHSGDRTMVMIDHDALALFLNQCEQLVPYGEETIDWDLELTYVLSD
ncbi:MAG TPA: SsgA family sporulation/cell division regulator [Mycobacteriales bacterium]|jgi:hypothetical protein